MKIHPILVVLGLMCATAVEAQQGDTVRRLKAVAIQSTHQHRQQSTTSINSITIPKEFFNHSVNANMVKALEELPGVQSMDIGAGFSKPMIRGSGFNRIAVVENGIKQQGQQWGADHGLEIDAYGVEGVNLIKGAASLLYGSDAMGGVIEVRPPAVRRKQGLFGEISLSGRSVNNAFGGSLMLGLRRGRWTLQGRYSEQHFGDYKVPTDTIVYLTQKLPLYGGRMKNTAGMERDASVTARYQRGRYSALYAVSDAYQKSGFFPGAHGIPDATRLTDDGDSRNIDLPYAWVNHLKVSTHQQYAADRTVWSADLGWQLNHREEWSLFHTHYDGQTAPAENPDQELMFHLHTATLNARMLRIVSNTLSYSVGFNSEAQTNSIGGYTFLLPSYRRQTAGLYTMAEWKVGSKLELSGGVRYDAGHVDIDSYRDPYLAAWLSAQGADSATVERYQWSCYGVERWLHDYSAAMGAVWKIDSSLLFKANLGRCFRLPAANELAANGVHHGTFRHEQGNPDLHSERGWQLDVDISKEWQSVRLELSPFCNLYSNYIFLRPTGEWSILPHAGQIYRYTEAPALLTGGEINLEWHLTPRLCYQLKGEYVYTRDLQRYTALTFSPPATMRNTLTYYLPFGDFYVEAHGIAPQNHVAQNEDPTPGALLCHLGAHIDLAPGAHHLRMTFAVHNLFNTRYYNHLSFYRQVEVPEPGRNISVSIRYEF